MQAQRIDNMFRFSYLKSSEEIIAKAKVKVTAVKRKIQEREERVKKIRAEFKITDTVYISLLEQARKAMKDQDNRMSYTVKNDAKPVPGVMTEDNLVIGAGTVNALLTETDFISAEESQVEKLDFVIRNLKDEEKEWSQGRKIGHSLGEAELLYLGF